MMATITELPGPLGAFESATVLTAQCNQPDQAGILKAPGPCRLKPPDTQFLSGYQLREVPQVPA